MWLHHVSPSSPVSVHNRLGDLVVVAVLAGRLMTQQYASPSQGRICADNCACCNNEMEVADHTFYLVLLFHKSLWPNCGVSYFLQPNAVIFQSLQPIAVLSQFLVAQSCRLQNLAAQYCCLQIFASRCRFLPSPCDPMLLWSNPSTLTIISPRSLGPSAVVPQSFHLNDNISQVLGAQCCCLQSLQLNLLSTKSLWSRAAASNACSPFYWQPSPCGPKLSSPKSLQPNLSAVKSL